MPLLTPYIYKSLASSQHLSASNYGNMFGVESFLCPQSHTVLRISQHNIHVVTYGGIAISNTNEAAIVNYGITTTKEIAIVQIYLNMVRAVANN